MKNYIMIVLTMLIGFSACKKVHNRKVISPETVVAPRTDLDSITPSSAASCYNTIGWKHNCIVALLREHQTGDDFDKMIDCVTSLYEQDMGEPLPVKQIQDKIEAMRPILSNQDSFIRKMIRSTQVLESFEKLKTDIDNLYDRKPIGYSFFI